MPRTTFLDQLEKLIVEPKAQEPLKILMIGAEVSPYANVGGYARVMAYLSRALIELGHEVRLFMPRFGFIDEEKYPMDVNLKGLKVPSGQAKEPIHLICNVKSHTTPSGPKTYFLENMEYYEKRANVYGYSDDPTRWSLLSRGCLEFLRKSDFAPDIIHANDWHTGIVSNYLSTIYKNNPKLLKIATLFTIHNLQYQGMFDHKNISELDFDDGRSPIASFFSPRLNKQNFMRRGIIYSDAVCTVSETYAREILTPEYGEELDRLLLEIRSKLFGITNGIDYDEFNPATDKLIEANYNLPTLGKRMLNKAALQKEFGLPQDPKTFLIGIVARLTEQKGLDLVGEVIDPFLKDFDAQLVVIGGGEGKYIKLFKDLKKKFPKKVGTHLMPNFTLPRLVFAGADVTLVPSKFEPSGLTQLEAMRYGAIPIVRATGGLADTVENFDAQKETGTGFVFKDFDRWAFFAQLVRAFEVFQHKEMWKDLQKRAMRADFSWEASASSYVEVYQKARHFHRQKLIAEGQIAPEV